MLSTDLPKSASEHLPFKIYFIMLHGLMFCFLQLRIQACDLGGLCNTTVATVSITTNFQPPVFVPSTYMASILETVSLGDVIVDVNATDADLNVSFVFKSTFSLIWEQYLCKCKNIIEKIKHYFYLNLNRNKQGLKRMLFNRTRQCKIQIINRIIFIK